MKKNIFTFLFVSVVLSLNAQTRTEFTLTLKDGNIVTGTTKVSTINLQTDYGKLVLPIKNVSSIKLGIHPDNSKKSEITNLAKQLLNTNEEMRYKAYSSLVALSINAIPVIEEVVAEGTYEPSDFSDYTLSGALNELRAIHNVQSNYNSKDVVNIDYEYNMGGIYEFKDVELKTEYGTLNIPREKIDKIDVSFYDESNPDGMKMFKLFAATHITSNQGAGWLKTGIMVKNGQLIQITANGEITLASLSNNKYKPDGASKSAYTDDFAINNNTNLTYGNVVFKIGENGVQTKAGALYNGRANASGMLYISIYETVYNASNSGFYTVKLKVD